MPPSLIKIRRAAHATAAKSMDFLKVGTVRLPICRDSQPEYVPHGFANPNTTSELTQTIKWLMQKQLLKQDVFLVGVPGYLRSHVALQFMASQISAAPRRMTSMANRFKELANKEFEYLSITRDTTESDIKQRREIRDGTATYSDSPAVNAALHGRVLIIDGVEKAERNVLPILNNLFENREMQLEDGRFLMSAKRFDKLLQQYSREKLTSYGTMEKLCEMAAPNVEKARIGVLLSMVYGMGSQQPYKSGMAAMEEGRMEIVDDGMPLFPVDNLLKAMRVWDAAPSYSQSQVLSLCYPDEVLLKESQKSTYADFKSRFGIEPSSPTPQSDQSQKPSKGPVTTGFISTPSLENHLSQLRLLSAVSDFCLLGARGSGKSTLVCELAGRLGYSDGQLETMVLYQDMNSRELLQQRRMLPNGDTVWEDSQLVKAAKEGSICILDGVERIHWSMAEVLSPLVHHRFLQLPDGSRLLGFTQYSILQTQMAGDELLAKRIFPIHDRFRLIALGDANSPKWLNEQLLSLFLFHTLTPMAMEEELEVIKGKISEVDEELARRLLRLVHSLRDSKDPALHSIATNSLSLRRVLFLLKCHAAHAHNDDLPEAIRRSTLARFMPSLVRDAFEAKLSESNLAQSGSRKRKMSAPKPTPCSEQGEKKLLLNGQKELMVPDILYYDNVEHSRVLSEMATSFTLGYHLLLIGNQGVGKNKVADRFLQESSRPRKYIQLHRDTTVQSLTVQSSVEDGLLKYSDSPLVQSIRDGYVLVVDEADKAPLHVIAILKSILDLSILYLADGRRILPVGQKSHSDKDIETHPEFRLIMLANRPGFPFAGNDLFSSLGDLFSVHVIDNPSRQSEVAMLRRYGPNVPVKSLERLADLFADLREQSDKGLMPYPYSTRELVSIVKHLEVFPNDLLEAVLSNVFDFDSYSRDSADMIRDVFKKHRFSLGGGSGGGGWWGRFTNGGGKGRGAVAEGEAAERLEIERAESDFDLSKLLDPTMGKVDPDNVPHVGGNTWAGGTGGYSTAGLGGVGGPFRLDAGHNVHQMTESAKRQVPPEVLKKAREVAEAEYKKRLKEIEMSAYDANAYQEIHGKIAKQVKLLRSIVESLEAKEHERQWAKHQTSGDIDDTKLIEGVTGEKTVYRRRVTQQPEPGTPQLKPKRLRLCFDVSGSMYRFNGYDGRLQKSLESALLVMEAFKGMDEKIRFEITGHSGDGPDIPFVKLGEEPTNEKERFDVLKRMLLHTQFCWSGDNTLEAIELAGVQLKKTAADYDESIAVVVSDANLDRYGITPRELAKAMEKGNGDGGVVECYLVLIGSLGEQAERLKKALPPGRAFVVKGAKEVPEVMQKIFTSTVCR